jgi:hypothetical protein
MESRRLYADTLRLAAETVGGAAHLARHLGVAPEELARWLSGRETIPLEPLLAALDLLGERPYIKRGLPAAFGESAS